MTVLERAASAEVVDDIVLPFAVESLSTRGRLVRLGAAIDQLVDQSIAAIGQLPHFVTGSLHRLQNCQQRCR